MLLPSGITYSLKYATNSSSGVWARLIARKGASLWTVEQLAEM
jgi:hypothetical protein